MSLRRIPHQFVLAFAFSAIAVGLAVATVQMGTVALRQADAVIAYATSELHGIDDLSIAHETLRRLLAYRADLVRAQVESSVLRGRRAMPRDARQQTAAIDAALTDMRNRVSADTVIDESATDELAALERRWSLTSSQTDVSAHDVSGVIAAVQPLLNAIGAASGLTNDPSVDGINFSDAILRFPLSLACGSEAASIAATQLASGSVTLRARFGVARLIARAQTAVEVGLEDAQDEVSVDPAAAALALAATRIDVTDFNAVKFHVTDAYVEADKPARAGRVDADLLAQVDAFTRSTFAIIDISRGQLERVTSTRLRQTRDWRGQVVWRTGAGLAFELTLMLTLAWISISTYTSGRKRMVAERATLEAQRAGLELQLTHANSQQALLRAQAQFHAVFEGAPTGIMIVDPQCRIVDSNEAARAMLDDAREPISADAIVRNYAAAIRSIFTGDLDGHAGECEYPDEGQRSRWIHVSISSVRDEAGTALLAILMLRDTTEAKTMEAQLVFEAGHDALTGLPNRKRFLTILQQALDDRQSTAAGATFCVVFIDFNDFKTINDSFGHQAGDKFLVDEAVRLRDSIRSSDIVARVGGDEFALMLVGADRADIERNIARLQAVLSVPINIEGQLVASSASFGIAAAEPHYRLAAEIIRDADTAMYHAKAQGGRKYVAFDSSMREKVVRRMQLSIDIIHALDHNEMQLLFQPIVDLRDGTICGCEALVRWRRADGSLIAPTEFIPLAEENGSIIDIGHWVTKTACEQMASWNALADDGKLPGLHPDFVMHINLAVPEVHHVDLLATLNATLAETRVARRQIVLEITEGIVLKNTEQTRSTLDGLTAAGFRLCIDDFGTGYSSLRYLNELPLHGFKIDRSFVSNGSGDLANASIVEMLMVLSRSLELQVVAEGIETPLQWERLRELGCCAGQGYLFAPALEAPLITTLLEAGAPLAPSPHSLEAAVRAIP